MNARKQNVKQNSFKTQKNPTNIKMAILITSS